MQNKLEKTSFIVFILSIILSALFFIPTNLISINIAKTIVISIGVLLPCILYLYNAFKNKTISFPKSAFANTIVLISASTIISSLLSPNITKSFFGQSFEIGSSSFLLLMILTTFLVSRLVSKDNDRLLSIYTAFLIPFLVLFVFHILRLFAGPAFLDFGIFSTLTATPIGTWFDFGIFAGMIFLLSFFAIKLLDIKKNIRFWVIVSMIMSFFVLFIVNLNILWIVLSVVLLSYGIYYYIKNSSSDNGTKSSLSRISVITLVFLVICIGLAWRGDAIATPVQKMLKIENGQITLPWQLTLDISTQTIKNKPLFGAGPNRFVNEYLLYKPQIINQSDFWNFEFNTGFSYISSFVVTHGIVGSVLWIMFFIFFVGLGIKSLKHIKTGFSRFAVLSTFFTTSFLWLMSIVHNPSYAIVFFTFIMTGLFISVMCKENIIVVREYGVPSDSLSKKLVPLFIIISILVLIIWALVYVKKFTAIAYFQSGISTLNSGKADGLEKARGSFLKALSWDKVDIYYQALAEVNISEINSIIQLLQAQSAKDPKSVDQELMKRVGALIEQAVTYTRNAIALDPLNYYNYIEEARISEIALSLKIANAYENAKTAYTNALSLNPYNPGLYLSLARIEAGENKLDEAQKYIGVVLQLKQNYTEAIFLLSQIQVSQGNIKEAINSVGVATQINPQSPVLFFQLGLLYFNEKDYENSALAFERAVSLSSDYANARYFLGLSYARLGRNTEALEQFEIIAKTNPENQEIALIISNLKAGKSVFTDAKPPIDKNPEKRKTLPVKEKTTNATKSTSVN